MSVKFAQLRCIEGDRDISPDQDWEFFLILQQGLLLGLRELGCINEIQLRLAEEELDRRATQGET